MISFVQLIYLEILPKMPVYTDYHNHPLGHDPNRHYDEETLSEWLDSALQKQITDLALTDHDRYFVPRGEEYIEAFLRFREGLPDNVKFRLGIEIDNDPQTSAESWRWLEKNYERFDFILASIHFIDDWAFDHPAYREEFDRWDINKLYERYFQEIQRLAKSELIDGLAHLDLIKIFGHRPTVDMTPLYEETLQLIKEQDLTVEISTAGWRKPVNEIYPSPGIISLLKRYQIPITTASDAHAPQHLAADYDRLVKILKEHKFSEVSVFEEHQRSMLTLKL